MPVSFLSPRDLSLFAVFGLVWLVGASTETLAQCPGGACGSRCPSCGPVFVPPPHFPPQPRNQPTPRPTQPVRSANNSRYLPPMPEMLRHRTPAHALPAVASRDGLPSPRTAPAASENRPAERSVIRGQEPDAAAQSAEVPILPTKLRLPSPEELGLLDDDASPARLPPSKEKAAKADWAMTRERLERWGALHYRLERAEQGWRFVCVLPHPTRSEAQHHIEVEAATDEAAMIALLERAETWLRTCR